MFQCLSVRGQVLKRALKWWLISFRPPVDSGSLLGPRDVAPPCKALSRPSRGRPQLGLVRGAERLGCIDATPVARGLKIIRSSFTLTSNRNHIACLTVLTCARASVLRGEACCDVIIPDFLACQALYQLAALRLTPATCVMYCANRANWANRVNPLSPYQEPEFRFLLKNGRSCGRCYMLDVISCMKNRIAPTPHANSYVANCYA